MDFFNKLKNLDANPKINEDFYSRTLSGGVITIVSTVIMFFLFMSEIRLFLYHSTETKLVVDTSRGEMLHVNFDMTFQSLPCSVVSVDTKDVTGEQHSDIRHDITKTRMDRFGNVIESKQGGIGAPKIERPLQRHGGRLEQNETYCGSCYGAESSDEHCCNSCDEVQEAYKKKNWGLSNPELIDQCQREGLFQQIKEQDGEGCNIKGFLEVSKVSGNFHFSPGKSLHQPNVEQSDLVPLQKESYNITHKINKLSFGMDFPGAVNPLDKVQWIQKTASSGIYQYFVKVVPTIYTDVRGKEIKSNQFSVTEHFKDVVGVQESPGVYFVYDFSPIKVIFTEENMPLLHFLTNICAIIGGIFTVSGIIDAFVYHGNEPLRRRWNLESTGDGGTILGYRVTE